MLDFARKAVAASRSRQREDLERDDLLAAALERFIEVIGEAAGKVSEGTRRALPAFPWREIVGMRNRLVLGYAAVDHGVIWNVVENDLPVLLKELEKAVDRP